MPRRVAKCRERPHDGCCIPNYSLQRRTLLREDARLRWTHNRAITRSQTVCCVGQKRHGTLSKITAFHARRRPWRNWPAFLPKGLHSGSLDAFRFIPLLASIPGLRAKLDRWLDRLLKVVASLNAQTKSPAARSSCEDQSCAGLSERAAMKRIYKLSLPKSHNLIGLPLFERDWRQSNPRHPTTSADQHLVRKFRVSPSIADVIADCWPRA